MAKSLDRRLDESGITREHSREVILRKGLLPFCDEVHCGLEAGKRFTEEVLKIKDYKLVTEYSLQDSHFMARELILAVFEKWRELEAERDELKAELQERYEIEAHREEMAKVQLSEMLKAIT